MKLYQIDYNKTELNLDGTSVFTRKRTYQVLADNEIGAVFRLGQIFNNDESYEIEILNVTLIK